jgi:hypothetical protein
MTRDEFENLLQANGIAFIGEAAWRVAQLVAAHEREECAKLCDAQQDDMPDGTPVTQFMSGQYVMAEYLSERIRARGQE